MSNACPRKGPLGGGLWLFWTQDTYFFYIRGVFWRIGGDILDIVYMFAFLGVHVSRAYIWAHMYAIVAQQMRTSTCPFGPGETPRGIPRATSRPGRPEHYHTWPDLVASGTKHYHGSQGRPPRDLGHQALSRRTPSSVRREVGPPDTERRGRTPQKPTSRRLASFEHKKTPLSD